MNFASVDDEIPAVSAAAKAANLLLKAAVIVNFVLFGLSWSEWFAGSEQHIGFADKIFGSLRIGGFRIDFVWIVLSTILIFLALLYFAVTFKLNRSSRVNLFFCLAEIFGFIAFIYHILVSGQLYFG